MTINNIKSYLKERPGYLKKGANSLLDILEGQGFIADINDVEIALAETRKEFKSTSVAETTTNYYSIQDEDGTTGKPFPSIDFEQFTPIKVWGKEGNWSVSYEAKQDEEEGKKKTDEAIAELIKHIDSRPPLQAPTVDTEKGSGVAVITDLHIGAQVGKLVVDTENYSISTVVDYLNEVAKQINDEKYGRVHLSILGDLIESFTGTNHSASWKELHELGYGSNVLIIAYEILSSFLSKINNLEVVYIVGGNHDRVSQKNDEDPQLGVAHTISHFLDKHLECNVFYNHMLLVASVDGIDYIMTHGHLPMIKRTPEYFVLNYAKNKNNFVMLLSGHLHSRSKTEQLNVSTVVSDAKRYRAMICPSIFTGNFYSESVGFTCSPGFVMFESKNGKPRTIDVTL
jgi:predicted phosphodiesterase